MKLFIKCRTVSTDELEIEFKSDNIWFQTRSNGEEKGTAIQLDRSDINVVYEALSKFLSGQSVNSDRIRWED